MKQHTIQRLNTLNQQFYAQIADSFAATRQHAWDGWKKLLPFILELKEMPQLTVLDIGCGTGRFGEFLVKEMPGAQISYLGLDNNEALLNIAQEKLRPSVSSLKLKNVDVIQALQLNKLSDKNSEEKYNLITAFGLIHHIPSFELRVKFLEAIKDALRPNGLAVVACWQFPNDESLMKRKLNPTLFEIDPQELEENDYLLPWQNREDIARYCHYVDKKEASEVAAKAGLIIQDTFFADGKEGNLNYYLILKASATQ